MIRTIFNGLNHYKVSADFNSYRLSPLAPHRVRFAPQNRLLEPADCSQWKGVEIIEGEICPDHIHLLLSIPYTKIRIPKPRILV